MRITSPSIFISWTSARPATGVVTPTRVKAVSGCQLHKSTGGLLALHGRAHPCVLDVNGLRLNAGGQQQGQKQGEGSGKRVCGGPWIDGLGLNGGGSGWLGCPGPPSNAAGSKPWVDVPSGGTWVHSRLLPAHCCSTLNHSGAGLLGRVAAEYKFIVVGRWQGVVVVQQPSR
jgi:hypothetical protein